MMTDTFAPSATAEEPARISVVLPVCNAAATLPALLGSLRAQTLSAFELIAIDDGSNDNSLEILLHHAALDSRIHALARGNGGVATARNLGVEVASAPLIAFLDADALWDRGKLYAHCALHRARPDLVASYARMAFVPAHADGLTGARALSKLAENPLDMLDILGENPIGTTSNMVVRRDSFLAIGGFDAASGAVCDRDLAARLVARGGPVVGLDMVLAGARLTVPGLSHDWAQMHADWRDLMARYIDDPRTRARLEAAYCRQVVQGALVSGGHAGMALRYALRSLHHDIRGFPEEPGRSLATLGAALVAPLVPARLRQRLFA
ncbi:glycosyltransferase family A protein [Novosphingobium sp. FSW06-99]|uniref:glycosyltransferase family 2 protein n=1 Tax=Novosphingobium sp. FSW06-99 TaxID=1739113 RepID=UPI00076D043A|nr:glycosyltransferase family A protein [Novosphingobium sp. FSW06-99]KUR80829.1 hypothetical protein AQZ49_02030 [Novosphingobium sp. FSW06-99]